MLHVVNWPHQLLLQQTLWLLSSSRVSKTVKRDYAPNTTNTNIDRQALKDIVQAAAYQGGRGGATDWVVASARKAAPSSTAKKSADSLPNYHDIVTNLAGQFATPKRKRPASQTKNFSVKTPTKAICKAWNVKQNEVPFTLFVNNLFVQLWYNNFSLFY